MQQYGALEGRDYPRECQDLYHGLPYFEHVKASWQQPVCEPQVWPCCDRHTGVPAAEQWVAPAHTALAEPLPCYALQEGAVLGSSLRCHYQMDEYPEMHCTGANLALNLRKFEVRRCGLVYCHVIRCSWLPQIKAGLRHCCCFMAWLHIADETQWQGLSWSSPASAPACGLTVQEEDAPLLKDSNNTGPTGLFEEHPRPGLEGELLGDCKLVGVTGGADRWQVRRGGQVGMVVCRCRGCAGHGSTSSCLGRQGACLGAGHVPTMPGDNPGRLLSICRSQPLARAARGGCSRASSRH